MGNAVIQLRNETVANWAAANPVLAAGEIGLETDTNKLKFGNGATAWNSLPYLVSAAPFKYGRYILSADQTSNMATGNHVEFNASQGSLGGLSTGTGQANGIVTLPAGKTYKITFTTRVIFSGSSGVLSIYIHDKTNNVNIGSNLTTYPQSASYNYSDSPICSVIITPQTDTDIAVRFDYSLQATELRANSTFLLVEEYAGV